ncbi:MAG: alpha-galactosidase [Bacteroidales bacterium]|nr:alpha-galactosidase [Bacteroidales bacterium]
MKRIVGLLSVALMLASCCGEPAQDRLLGPGGKALKDIEVSVQTETPEAFPGMTVRTVSFTNAGSEPVLVSAMETSRIQFKSKDLWGLEPMTYEDRRDWVQPIVKGYHQDNYLGMSASDYGGGTPLVSLWNADKNITIGLVEPCLRIVSIPVTRKGNVTESVIRKDYSEPVELKPGETLTSYANFIIEGTGDFFGPVREFSEYMQAVNGIQAPVSPDEAYDAVWCAWGYERQFTVDEVIGTLPKVVELGFKWVDVDDGFQICEGDWQANERIGKDGMRRMTDAIHAAGLKAKLWWAPLLADSTSRAVAEHPGMMLIQKDGKHEFVGWWDSWYLSPVNQEAWDFTADVVDLFLRDWGFDGFKMDGQQLNLSEADYNPASGLAYPEEAQERHPEYFQRIYERANAIKPGCVLQICPCGCAINYFCTPWMNQAVASDPTSSFQIRMKRKVYAALCPDLAYYADHVELSDGGLDFPSQIGVGGIIGTKFTWPKPNPHAEQNGGSILTPEKEALLKKWVPIYNEKMLSKGKYLGLYSYGFDYPEGHAIEKDGAMYYAFYAPSWNGGAIELRGLSADRKYTVTEYTADEPRSFEIDGSNPVIHPVFENNYLIEVK